VAGIDNPALALGRNGQVADFSHNISEPGFRIDDDSLAREISIFATVRGAPMAGDLHEVPSGEPASKVELIAMLPIG
jgi:hypothetical protein